MAKKNLATVRITGLPLVRQDLLKFVQSQTKDEAVLNELGTTVVNQIRKRTQAGLEDYKQRELTDTTKEIRKIVGKGTKTGDFFKPERSNLTFTGQLLNALSFKLEAAKATINFFLKEGRAPANPLNKFAAEQLRSGIKDASSDSDLKRAAINIASLKPKEKTNKEIRKDLELRGRTFMFISPSLMSQLQSKIAQTLRKRLSLYKKIRSK